MKRRVAVWKRKLSNYDGFKHTVEVKKFRVEVLAVEEGFAMIRIYDPKEPRVPFCVREDQLMK